MYRISATRIAAATALMLAGLVSAPQLREFDILAGAGIATRFCAGATLFGLGLRLVL